jgi:hypothetical protein
MQNGERKMQSAKVTTEQFNDVLSALLHFAF